SVIPQPCIGSSWSAFSTSMSSVPWSRSGRSPSFRPAIVRPSFRASKEDAPAPFERQGEYARGGPGHEGRSGAAGEPLLRRCELPVPGTLPGTPLTDGRGIAILPNMTNRDDVATTLRAIRAKLDLTQEQLAERLGVSFATINRWEGGSNMPQKAARAAIAALAAEAGIDAGAPGLESSAAAAQVTSRRRKRARAAVPSTKPMEQMLWDAACSIRGEKEAAKFKDYLLPLLFLKRLSDVFDDEIDRLEQEYGDRETALEIA